MATLLKTPAGWPRPMLGKAAPADPTDLDAAVRAGAFDGFKKGVRTLAAAGIVAEIRTAGLRGRGGAGFPTADKWQAAAATQADRRYVVANGYGERCEQRVHRLADHRDRGDQAARGGDRRG